MNRIGQGVSHTLATPKQEKDNAMNTITKMWIVQERWKDGPWVVHVGTNGTFEDARKTYLERLDNPIWHGDNNERKWRMVCRTITDDVYEG